MNFTFSKNIVDVLHIYTHYSIMSIMLYCIIPIILTCMSPPHTEFSLQKLKKEECPRFVMISE